MNRLRVCLLLFVFTSVVAPRAEESNAAPSPVTSNAPPASITIDGTTYEDIRWESVTPTTVTIFHKTGVATIPLWTLPPDLQKRFGYDPQKAAASLQEQERQRQYLKYRADTRLVLGSKLVETNQVQEKGGTIVATPASVKADDGQTYTGTILEGTKVVGFAYVRETSPYLRGSYVQRVPSQFASEDFFVKDFFPSNNIGTTVSFRGAPINPIGGYPAWAVAGKPSFEEWQKLQK